MPAPARPRPRRPSVRLVVVAVVVVLVAGLVVAVVRGARGYYVYSPGTAPVLTGDPACQGTKELRLPGGRPCVRIDVPPKLAHALDGTLFMVDVDVGQATPIQYALGKLHLLNTFDQGAQLIPANNYTGGLPTAQVNCESTAEMTGSQLNAPVAALRRLGYRVNEVDRGAQLGLVEPGSPAAAAGLACNQTVTAVNGRPITTANALVAAIQQEKPGQTIALTVAPPPGQTGTKTVPVTLGHFPAQAALAAHQTPGSVYLGVSSSTNLVYNLPFDVTIDSGDIGGPSAGLAFTLGIIDLLSNGKLTNGAKVAATGEILPNGAVTDVGGVAQKTVAVRNAGATVFFVPKGEYKDARSQAGSHLKIFPVTTLDQALADLKTLGGQVPPAPPAPATTSPPG